MDTKVRESIEKINLKGVLRQNESLAAHCTFKVGGPADWYFRPAEPESLRQSLLWARAAGLPWFILGGGANIVPSDRGFRGLVVDTSDLTAWSVEGSRCRAQAGIAVSTLSGHLADAGLSGLDFIYAMPGSLGGAVYMNARCYDGEMSAILRRVRYLDENLEWASMELAASDFAYKLSPFTNRRRVIVEAEMELQPGDTAALWDRMRSLEADRTAKGHFLAPSAGSVFKNNHALGQPSGKIIDSLGLRGLRIGGAKISDAHANIFINAGGASARDIRDLVETVAGRVKNELGHELEAEILFIGDWDAD